jgi:hypothetical protein
VFLQISLGLGLWTLLDAQGHGSVQLGTIPNDPSLVGVSFYAAGVLFDASAGVISTATNAEPFEIIR